MIPPHIRILFILGAQHNLRPGHHPTRLDGDIQLGPQPSAALDLRFREGIILWPCENPLGSFIGIQDLTILDVKLMIFDWILMKFSASGSKFHELL